MFESILSKIGLSLITKLLSALAQWVTAMIEKAKQVSALKKNSGNLKEAIKSGDDNAIQKAGANSLNNSDNT